MNKLYLTCFSFSEILKILTLTFITSVCFNSISMTPFIIYIYFISFFDLKAMFWYHICHFSFYYFLQLLLGITNFFLWFVIHLKTFYGKSHDDRHFFQMINDAIWNKFRSIFPMKTKTSILFTVPMLRYKHFKRTLH